MNTAEAYGNNRTAGILGWNGTCLHRLKLTSGRTSLYAALNRETVLTIATAKIGSQTRQTPEYEQFNKFQSLFGGLWEFALRQVSASRRDCPTRTVLSMEKAAVPRGHLPLRFGTTFRLPPVWFLRSVRRRRCPSTSKSGSP
jgi:hypothetical protein